ncbi:hypothetical protein E2C01_006947 [Portunus trituberculatus]|uniref:Uncharacterized protein n=1 Tax=Portunus trituberculatus TaxID=210409 RepID=A0A5B7CY51_PORTR|nr:hypothetical protein [Portunus trituberculatus]
MTKPGCSVTKEEKGLFKVIFWGLLMTAGRWRFVGVKCVSHRRRDTRRTPCEAARLKIASVFPIGVFTPDAKLWDRCQPHRKQRFQDRRASDFSCHSIADSTHMPPWDSRLCAFFGLTPQLSHIHYPSP